MAADASKWGWSNVDGNTFLRSEPTPVYADLQLAIYRALLVSLLSPSLVRRLHLAQSLELFRRGRQETGTKLRILFLCSLSLGGAYTSPDPPISKRSLLLTKLTLDFKINGLRDTGYVSPDSDDELYKSWLGGDNAPGKLRENMSDES